MRRHQNGNSPSRRSNVPSPALLSLPLERPGPETGNSAPVDRECSRQARRTSRPGTGPAISSGCSRGRCDDDAGIGLSLPGNSAASMALSCQGGGVHSTMNGLSDCAGEEAKISQFSRLGVFPRVLNREVEQAHVRQSAFMRKTSAVRWGTIPIEVSSQIIY